MKFRYLIAGALLAATSAACWAERYPSRPIRLLVGFAAGGPTDVAARAYASRLGQLLGQPVVVDNRAGAAGAIAANMTARAEPDGYTLDFVTSPMMTMVPVVQKSAGYDPVKGFTPVGLVSDYANVLLVSKASPVRNLTDLTRYAATHAGGVTYGSAGIGASNHLCAELLAQMSGTPMLHVPYKGNAQAMTDLIGGKIDYMFDATGTAISQIRGGNVRPLAVTSAQRSPALPDVPTMAEAGIKDYRMSGWFAVIGPPKLPADVVDALVKAHLALARDAAFQTSLRQAGYEPLIAGPAALSERIVKDLALWRGVVKTAGIQPQ
ncbi:Bug family tripartite tricarboxylate transporter substrate binding protein [Cupriavidus sp. 2TAF22]|uniref:Bug family tripartite tricarboxylate transporter substrate binding protein n=1 Tax=unclassified Cupriavidus TaxID=2640874 RepID=UPI003F9228AF